jgi:hypothetical protein
MRLDATRKLFFGFKIDSKMREALAQATPGDRHYFAEDSPYLRVIANGDEQWIGKIVEIPIAPTEVEDIQRNVLSILNRIAPGARHSASAMRIFTIDENAAPPPPTPKPGDDDDDRGSSGGYRSY